MELVIIKGREMIDSGLDEQILEFDRKNMKPILEAAGIEFPEEKRRRVFQDARPTFIIAFDNRRIAGYVEYSRSWNNPDNIYISSIQIDERHRNTTLILKLLDKFRSAVSEEDFVGFEVNVQKANRRAAEMYRKIGFKMEANPGNELSWLATADRKLLEDSPLVPLINRWRKKRLL